MNNEKYSIVIIDDETEILNVLSRFLIRNPNFSVTTYSNPISGLNAIEKSNVNSVSSMVELIDAHRRFDQSQKAIKSIDELNSGLIDKIGSNTK